MQCPERSPKGEVEGHCFLFFCYILECSDGSYYVGVSEDPQDRLKTHNEGKGADWTARRRPVKLVWTEGHTTLAAARQREIQIKRWGHANKAKLVGGSPRSAAGDSGQA